MYFKIQFLGLLLDIIGVIIVFFYSPENKPDGLLGGDDDLAFIKRNRTMKWGLATICAGFIFQMVALFLS